MQKCERGGQRCVSLTNITLLPIKKKGDNNVFLMWMSVYFQFHCVLVAFTYPLDFPLIWNMQAQWHLVMVTYQDIVQFFTHITVQLETLEGKSTIDLQKKPRTWWINKYQSRKCNDYAQVINKKQSENHIIAGRTISSLHKLSKQNKDQ